MKKIIFLIILVLSFSVAARQIDGFIEFEFHSDSLSIWHYQAWRNCGAIYTMDLSIIDSTITLMENDTSQHWYRCCCHFDLAATISTPPPGQYRLIIQTTNFVNGDTAMVADTVLIIEEAQLITYSDPECLNHFKKNYGQIDIPLVDHYESGCIESLEPALYVRTENDNVVIDWSTPLINPDVAPWWQGYLSNDTFFVTMDDTSISNISFCHHFLNARFGPVPSGKYTLSFMDGTFGYPTFIIGDEYIIEIDNNDLILTWNVADLNCCLVPFWEGWLEDNVFQVVMTDTGGLCNCLCPFELTARFGPFQPGSYNVNFHNSSQDPVEFTINNLEKTTTITLLSYYQSSCYDPTKIESGHPLPADFSLLRCYPNPFNASINIAFYLPTADRIEIKIYSITGSLVHTIQTDYSEAGLYSVLWNKVNAPSGLYFVRFNSSAGIHLTTKILLLK